MAAPGLSCSMWDPVPWPGSNPRPLPWKCGVLTTGLPGKSLLLLLYLFLLLPWSIAPLPLALLGMWCGRRYMDVGQDRPFVILASWLASGQTSVFPSIKWGQYCLFCETVWKFNYLHKESGRIQTCEVSGFPSLFLPPKTKQNQTLNFSSNIECWLFIWADCGGAFLLFPLIFGCTV